MKAILPCAGYATRLGDLTLDKPKHLLEVQGEPIINHVVRKVCELPSVDTIYIVTNAKFYPVFQDWLAGFQSTVPIMLLNDQTTSNEDRLGQIGDIQFVIGKKSIDDDVIVVAGDNLFNFSLIPSYNTFMKSGNVLNALYDVSSMDTARQLGIATLNATNEITEFAEKPEQPNSTLASLGIYYFQKHQVPMLGNYLASGGLPDKMGYFMEWLIQHHELSGHVYTEKWFDIGWQESLDEARLHFQK